MFNLPWYAWLNVLALPCLWAYLMLEYALQGKAKWYRQYTTVALVACACTPFLYWNPAVNALFTPLQPGLTLLIAPLASWTIGLTFIQLVACGWMWLGRERINEETLPASVQACAPVDLDGDDVDLDGGVSPSNNNAEVGKAISSLFSPDATLDDSVSGVMTLLGAGELDDASGELVLPLLLQLVFVGGVLVGPVVWGVWLVVT